MVSRLRFQIMNLDRLMIFAGESIAAEEVLTEQRRKSRSEHAVAGAAEKVSTGNGLVR